MLLMVFTIYDSCSGVYDRPFVARSEGEAKRSFSDVACDADHPIGKHPEHFALYRLGTYDDNTGKIDGEAPIHVANAHELIAAARVIKPGSLKPNGPNVGEFVETVESFGGTD